MGPSKYVKYELKKRFVKTFTSLSFSFVKTCGQKKKNQENNIVLLCKVVLNL